MASWTKLGNLRGPRGPAGANGLSSDVAQDDGKVSLDTVQDTTFNGFRYNPKTGRLVVEQLDGDTPVSLPQDNFLRAQDYLNWVFTRRTLAFRWWNAKNPTHLLMEVS